MYRSKSLCKTWLRLYGTPPYYGVLFMEINNKIKCNINSFFPKTVAQWFREFTTMLVINSNPVGDFKIVTFLYKILKRNFLGWGGGVTSEHYKI